MERYFGVTPPSVHRMVVELERRGLIRRLPRQARSIALCIPAAGNSPHPACNRSGNLCGGVLFRRRRSFRPRLVRLARSGATRSRSGKPACDGGRARRSPPRGPSPRARRSGALNLVPPAGLDRRPTLNDAAIERADARRPRSRPSISETSHRIVSRSVKGR